MKLKFFSLIAATCIITTAANAQLKVLPNSGKVKVGLEPPPAGGSDDATNLLRLHVYGPNGDFRTGGKIGIGDFSAPAWNVFIGEYGDNDADQLWLSGKMGLYLTYGQYGQNVIGYYNPSQGNAFRYNCDVYANGIMLSSDARFKTNVQKIGSALELLTKLNGVSYNLLPQELDKARQSGNLSECAMKAAAEAANMPLSEKDKRSKAFFDKLEQEQKQPGPKRLGLIAQEVQQVLPELVKQDSSNYLYIDYVGLIPVLIEGVKEQEAIIDVQKDKIAELENRLSSLENKISGLSLSETGISGVTANTGSYLYQNAPNPFYSTTVITYFLASNVKAAVINVFNMQGALLKTIPLTQKSGKGDISINGTELKAGMYIYNLVTDGAEADVKRMTLIK